MHTLNLNISLFQYDSASIMKFIQQSMSLHANHVTSLIIWWSPMVHGSDYFLLAFECTCRGCELTWRKFLSAVLVPWYTHECFLFSVSGRPFADNALFHMNSPTTTAATTTIWFWCHNLFWIRFLLLLNSAVPYICSKMFRHPFLHPFLWRLR